MISPLECTILCQLFAKKDYAEQVVPYIQEEYFHDSSAGLIYRLYAKFYNHFHVIPSYVAIRIGLDTVPSLSEREAQAAQDTLAVVQAATPLDDTQDTWLVEQTEDYCQDRAVYVGLQKCIAVMDDPQTPKHAISTIMKDALSVSFDTSIGHDYFEDASARWEFYHAPETRIPFDLDTFNKMSKGGTPKKTLNVIVAGTNVGKSLALCHFAAAAKRMSHNVLYISLEMREEWIGARIDANMMDIPMDDVEQLPRPLYTQKILHLKSLSTGKLIIKEYPTGTASVANFKVLLHELRNRENFVPELVLVDGLNNTKAASVKMGGSVNSYQYLKSVSEEMRAFACEEDVALWTACQFNRTGFSSSDPGLQDTGESFAIPQTADFMVALMQNEELEKLNQIGIIPLKNRYKKKQSYSQQLMGIDTDRMKLYELSAAQLAAAISTPPAGMMTSGAGKPPLVSGATRRPRVLTTLKAESEGA